MTKSLKWPTFKPRDYVIAFPPIDISGGQFIAPTYVYTKTEEIVLAPKAFIVALAEGSLPDALMASDRTRHLTTGKKSTSAVKLGFRKYSPKSLEVFNTALLHFLAWTEMRNEEDQAPDKFNIKNILHYRPPKCLEYGSLEDYENDMMDKRRPGLRSLNPNTIKTRITIANAFISFSLAQGYRHKNFSPYLSNVNKAYLDRTELHRIFAKSATVPDIEELAIFVRSRRLLRDRVAAGLMIFGGLRRQEIITMSLSDVPRRLELKKVWGNRVSLNVFGKGHKWRTATIPTWVYDDLQEFASIERKKIRRRLLTRGLTLPMGPKSPVFFNTQQTSRFGKALSPKFIRNIYKGSVLKHPHNARHAFACWRLLELLAMRSESLGQSPLTTLLESGMHQDIKAILSNELGHNDPDTTDTYLKWAHSHAPTAASLHNLLLRIQRVNNGK